MATTQEKLKCIQREIAYRKLVYPPRVAKGGMTQDEASREITTMQEIESDYRERCDLETGQGKLPL